MVATAFNGTVGLRREDSFQDEVTAGEFESPGNGGPVYLFDVDLSGIKQQMSENKNMKVRPAATNPKYRTLTYGEVPFRMYAFPIGDGNNAAAGAQAALLTVQDEMFLNAFGGQTRSYTAGMTGAGTASAPEVDEGDLDSTPVYGWLFHYDVSASVGRPVAYSTVTDGGVGNPDVVNLVTGFQTLPGNTADTLHGVVSYEPRWDVMGDYGDANHHTHAMFFDMEDAEDIYEIRGAKYDLGQITITAGEPVEFQCTAKYATFTPSEQIAATPSFGDPEGAPGKVAGQGIATNCHLANTGANIYDAVTQFWDTITITLGIEYEARMGPNARNGVHGFHPSVASYDATTVEMTVPFDNAWMTDYRAGTEKHLMIQIGDQPSDCRFFYFARLSWDDEPERTEVGGRSAMILRFRALEPAVDISSLSAAGANRARSKFVYGRVG